MGAAVRDAWPHQKRHPLRPRGPLHQQQRRKAQAAARTGGRKTLESLSLCCRFHPLCPPPRRRRRCSLPYCEWAAHPRALRAPQRVKRRRVTHGVGGCGGGRLYCHWRWRRLPPPLLQLQRPTSHAAPLPPRWCGACCCRHRSEQEGQCGALGPLRSSPRSPRRPHRRPRAGSQRRSHKMLGGG